MTDLIARMDSYGRKGWIIATVISFILFWPVGLALFVFLIWSGRMGCSKWKSENWRRMGTRMRSSGNSAFDEYKAETIRRLEEEQEAFGDFLDKLRRARDKSEFEDFMTSRKGNGGPAPEAA